MVSEYPRTASRCFPRSPAVGDLHTSVLELARHAETSIGVHRAHWKVIQSLRTDVAEMKNQQATLELERAREKGARDRTTLIAFGAFSVVTTLVQVVLSLWNG